MTKIGCLFDKKEDIDLLVIKALGAALTILTFCGYLHAVSRIDLLLNVHIMAFAAILLATTILGYFVFHVKVRTDSSSDATLFNLFSTIIAFTSEARSCLLVLLISNELYSWMNKTTLNMIRFFTFLFSLIYVFNIAGVTCCSLIKHLSPTLYLRMSQSWISAKIILAVEIIASVLTILTVVNECKPDQQGHRISCVRNFMFNIMANVALASSVILMIMDYALQYGRGLTKLFGNLFRNINQPQRESESATANVVIQVRLFDIYF